MTDTINSQKTAHLTMEQIHQTADQLVSEGVKVTQQAIKDRIGGSFSTINKGLRLWRSEKNVIQHSENVTLPHDLESRFTVAVTQLWEQAQSLANQRLESERQALQNAKDEVLSELSDMDEQLEQVELELLTTQSDLATATASNAEYVKSVDELNKSNIAQGTELQRLHEKLSAEREKSGILQEKLDLATADNASLTADKATAQSDLKHALAEIDRLNKALDIATASNAELTANNAKLITSNATAQADNANLLGKLETLQIQLQQGLEREKGQADKLDQLNAKITDMTASNATAQAEIDRLNTAIDQATKPNKVQKPKFNAPKKL